MSYSGVANLNESSPPPLVGRAVETDLISRAIEIGKGLFFSGPAGVGKSRLMSEAHSVLKQQGFDVIEILGAQATVSIPLTPLLGLIDLEQPGDLARLVLTELNRRARNGPVAMLVDDIHQLDDGSAAIINRIAVSGLAQVFATHRTSEPAPTAAEALWKDGHLDRIDVQPLTRQHTRELADTLLGPLDSTTHEWLWDITAGHPLFLRELLTDAQLSDRVKHSGQVASIVPPEGIPPRLLEIIGRKVHALAGEKRRALDLVAVCGSAPADVISTLGGGAALRSLIDEGTCLLSRGEVFPSHPLITEAAVASLAPAEKRQLRIDLANGLDEVDGDHDVKAVLMRLEADEQPDANQLRYAFQSTLESRNAKLAQRIGSALLEQQADPMVAARLGTAYAMNQDWQRADPLFEQAIELGSADQVDEFYLMWLGARFEFSNDPTEGMALAQQVVASTSGVANQVARALSFRVRMFVEPLDKIYEEQQSMLDENLDERARAMVALNQTLLARTMLRPQIAAELADAEFDLDDDVLAGGRNLISRATALMWTEGIDPALALLDEWWPEVAERGDADLEALVHMARFIIQSAARNTTKAQVALDALRDIEYRIVDQRSENILLGDRVLLESRTAVFQTAAEDYVHRYETADPATFAFGGTALLIAASRAARRDGADPKPLRERAVAHARARGAVLDEVWALREEYSLGDSATEETVARLEEIASVAGPGLARFLADEAAAHLAGDAAALDQVSLDLEAFGAIGAAWDAVAAAQLFHRRSGDMTSALRSERRSHQLAALDPLARSPIHALMEPVLTDRELEVAVLVASGKTNAETGDELFLSPRTVGRHLERIFTRLDIHSRGEIAEIISTLDLEIG